MPKAYVLMTAMPPTVGHMNLVRFARNLAQDGRVNVILNTQPHEPYATERALALKRAFLNSDMGGQVRLHHIHKTLPQAPEECDSPDGFWEMWRRLLNERGFVKGDYIVASEDYGITLAEKVGGHFMPYDFDRDIHFTKATYVRDNTLANWDWMIPEFKSYLQTTVTVFGAESCGKTTLSRGLAADMGGTWIPEYARPFLEIVGSELTNKSMTDIWKGQKAYQMHSGVVSDSPVIFQDTDLVTTLGYWQFWSPESVPEGLEVDAFSLRSDLYIVMNSKIPFEKDPLRYGGDKRESDDQYWIDLCENLGLNYHYIESISPYDQLLEAEELVDDILNDVSLRLQFDRTFND